MAISVVPEETPDQSTLHDLPDPPVFSLGWWMTHTMTEIPPDSVGWLTSQGWRITDIVYDTTTTPKTPYYAMTRESLNNIYVLQSLLNAYTSATNDAKLFNETRYNEVVTDWTEMIASSQVHFEAQITEQNAHVTLFLDDLDTYMDAVDTLISDNRTQIVADAAVATTALTALNTKLNDLETNAENTAATIEGLLANQASYLSTFMTDFVTKLAELQTNYTAHLTQIQTLLSEAGTNLETFATTQAAELAELEAAYTAHADDLASLLTTADGYLTTITDEISAVLTAAETDYTDLDTEINAVLTSATSTLSSFATDYNSVLAALQSDYSLHAPRTEGFLDGLGTTELARINEKFRASLSVQTQELTDKGLYTGTVPTDLREKNTRDKNEEIAALNDRLNREKLENQHQLYGQQVAMRTATMAGQDRLHTVRQEILRYQAAQITGLYSLLQAFRDRTMNAKTTLYSLREANVRLGIEVKSRLYDIGQTIQRLLVDEAARLQQLQQAVTQWKATTRDRLLEQIQQVVTQNLAGVDKQHETQQNVSRSTEASRTALLAQLQDAVKGILAGKERYAAMTMQTASTLAEHKHKAIVEKMNETAVRLEGLRGMHAENMKLMAYQLDERNKLLVGIYGFVERREDIGPSFKDLAQVVTGLGDSGGGWLTP